MQQNFPSLDLDVLIPLQLLGQMDPAALDDPSCPYDEDTKEILRPVLGFAQGATSSTSSWGGLTGVDQMMKSLEGVYKGLGNLNATGKEKAQIYRAQLGAIEKAVALKAQLLNLKQLGDFQTAVMEILETVMTPEQREEFLSVMKEKVTHV